MQRLPAKQYYFGDNNTYYLRDNPALPVRIKTKATANGYIYDGSALNGGYRWYENGQLYTGFKHYMGTYYSFVDGVRQNAGWRHAWDLYVLHGQSKRMLSKDGRQSTASVITLVMWRRILYALLFEIITTKSSHRTVCAMTTFVL